VSGRAFDKAVRRKPLAFAADAVGSMGIACDERNWRQAGDNKLILASNQSGAWEGFPWVPLLYGNAPQWPASSIMEL